MKQFLLANRFIILGTMVGLATVYLLSLQIVESRLATLSAVLGQDILLKHTAIKTVATDVANGKVSTRAQALVVDCSLAERAQFENRLVKLEESLGAQELDELERLFNICGDVQATKRAISLLDLESETNDLRELMRVRKMVGDYTGSDALLSIAEQILENEQRISALTFDQVSLQKDIINRLQAGLSVNSESATELRMAAQVLSAELIALVSLNGELRNAL